MSTSILPPLPPKLLDFRAFLWMVWLHLGLPNPTEVQLDIANWLQYGPRRKVIEAFRGVGKSWITSAYVVWRLRLNPQLNFLVVSASKTRSDDFSTFTLRLINELPVLQCLIPTPDQRNSKIAFDVAPAQADHAPSVKSVGIFGQLTGGRADEIIADDVEVPNTSGTQGMREKLSEAVKEFDAILKPGGIITYLGTPQTEDSLYNLLPERGYTTRIWPARFPTPEKMVAYGDKLAPFINDRLAADSSLVGRSTDPARFTDIDLMEREASYGRSGFLLQFMLDTSLSDAERYPLRLSDLLVMNTNIDTAPEKVIRAATPDYLVNDIPNVGMNGDRWYLPWIPKDVNWIEYKGAVMAIDPSGRGTDETAYAIVKQLNGFLFVLDAGGVPGGYDEKALFTLANLAKTYKVNSIICETNFGDGMFEQLLRPVLRKVYPVLVDEDIKGIRHSTQKEKRIIDTLEPVMNQHRLIIDRDIVIKDIKSTEHLPPESRQKYQLFYQLTRITRDRGCLAHDDRLDALAMAVNYWVEVMAQDADRKINDRKREMLERELAVFLGRAEAGLDTLILGGDPLLVGSPGRWQARGFLDE